MTIFNKQIIHTYSILITLIAITLAIGAYFSQTTFLELIDHRTIDLRFKSRGAIKPGPEVVLAVVDDKSIDVEGQWPWPRAKMADMINRISDAGARVIAFDISFSEPGNSINIIKSIEKIEKKTGDLKIKDRKLAAYLKTLKIESDDDLLLANTIRDSKAKIVLGYFFQTDRKSGSHLDETDISAHGENIRKSKYKVVKFDSTESKNIDFIKVQLPQSNLKIFSDAADYSGFFTFHPDKDGVYRWIPAVIEYDESLYAPLSLMAISAYLDEQFVVRVADYGIKELKIGDIRIPTDERGRILINYRGKSKTFPHIPVTDILNDNIDEDLFRDKIVVVGVTAEAVYDLRVTPFEEGFPGVEIHANIIDSLLSGDFLQQPKWTMAYDIIIIIITAMLLAVLLPMFEMATGTLIGCILFFGHIMLCQYIFSHKGVVINYIYPLFVIIIAYIGISSYRFFIESKQKRFIKEAFATYLAPSVVKQIIDTPGKLVLGGEKRDITAFFSDVQGFTGISEKLKPEELVELLNDFLTEMTDIILRHEGTVDKFEGDAIIAFFGAPNDLENHAKTACLACIEMQRRLKELREKWKSENRPELLMRIGLSSGSAVVGNMGSRNRMDYTMMGDTVNTAARLEGVNKVYSTYTMISDSTFAQVGSGNSIVSREIDSILVVGKKEPVTIYELIGLKQDLSDVTLELVELYHQGLKAYREMDWEKAMGLFSRIKKINQDDGPSKILFERCNKYKSDPPDEAWNKAYSILNK